MRLACPNDDNIVVNLPEFDVRSKLLAENPIAASRWYNKLVNAIFKTLIGLESAENLRSSNIPVKSRIEGIFGKPVAFATVTESQGRLSNHLHGVVWTDLSPRLVQKYLNEPDILEVIFLF